jgi:amino acid transporter
LLKTDILPVKGYLQPLSGWWLVVWAPVIFIFNGYGVFMPDSWDAPTFVFAYGSGFIFAAIYLGSKIWDTAIRRKKFMLYKPASTLDYTTDVPEIEAYTIACEQQRAEAPRTLGQKVSDALF